jgi:cytochrome c-type biogenesis protein CcmH/NrfG
MQATNITTIFLLLIALGMGCDRPREQVRPAVVPAHQTVTEQLPYYYGLIEEYKTILAEDPNNLASLIALAHAYAGGNEWDKAITLYEHALRIDPHNADLLTDLGIACRSAGQIDRALGEFHKAVENDPMHQNARFQMGIVYAYDKKNYPAAIRVWKELLHISPHHDEAEYMKHCIVKFGEIARKGGR